MTNAEIVRALPELKSLKYDLKALDSRIENLRKQREQLDHEIHVLDGVDTVIDGIAVHETDLKDPDAKNIYGKVYNLGAVAHEVGRSGEVYPNANTQSDWGIKLYWRDDEYDRRQEAWLNTGWAFKDAIEVVRRFVTRNERPSEEHQVMCRARHRLDPDGIATKRRRLAYEAAWMAGHKDLAQEILLGRAKVPKPKKEAA